MQMKDGKLAKTGSTQKWVPGEALGHAGFVGDAKLNTSADYETHSHPAP